MARRVWWSLSFICWAGQAAAQLPPPDPLPPPTGQATVLTVLDSKTRNLAPIGATGVDLSSDTALNGLGRSTASAGIGLGPAPHITVVATKTGLATGAATAILYYSLRVTTTLPINPTVLPIPVSYSAVLQAEASSASPQSGASAQLFLSDQQQLLTSGHSYSVCASAGGNCFFGVPVGAGPWPSAQTVNGSFTLPFGDVVNVALVAQAFARADNRSDVSTRAFVDPVFTIDPAFAAANPGLALELSAGVGNGPLPVPEPGSALLMAAGLAGLAGWRRRQAAAGRQPRGMAASSRFV